MRVAVVSSHPIQYYAPIFRALSGRLELEVLYAHRPTPAEQASAGFGTAFEWDVDLISGYRSRFALNRAKRPTTSSFFGCDTREIARYIRNGKFDAVLVLGWYLKSFLQAIIASKRAGIPVIVRGDSQLQTPFSFPKRLLKKISYPLALRVFDAALYVGVRSREYMKNYGYPSRRLFFSPHCVDAERFREHGTAAVGAGLRQQVGIGSEETVVLFAGKLLPIKRPLDVVEAAALCRGNNRRHITVMVAGAGPLERAVRQRAAELGVKLVLLGFRNQSEMPACYAACDLLVLPSSSETWGLVANEALACERPIIVSDAVGCAPDLAFDGIVGRTFPVGNYRSLSESIVATLESPPSRAEIQMRSRAYSIDSACDGIIEALQFVTTQRVGRDMDV